MSSSPTSHVTANTSTPLQPNQCEEDPCFVCWLQAKVAADPDTAAATFSDTAALRPYLIGIRRQGSITNQFDDAMVVLVNLLEDEEQPAYEAAIEKELRDALATAAGTVSSQLKLIPCTVSGLWVAGYFKTSTDPGYERARSYYGAVKKRDGTTASLVKMKADLAAMKAALAAKKADLAAKKTELAAKKVELAAKEAELATKKAEQAAATLAGDTEAVEACKAAITALNTEISALKDKKKGIPALEKSIADLESPTKGIPKDEAAITALEAKIKAAEEEDLPEQNAAVDSEAEGMDAVAVPVPDGDGRGWLEQGRAQMAPAVYTDAYAYYIHHASKPKLFEHSSVALTIGYPGGFRYYSAKYVNEYLNALAAGKSGEELTKGVSYPPKVTLDGDPAPVGIYIPGGGSVTRYDKDSAKLVQKRAADKTVETYLSTGGAETKLVDGDVIALWDSGVGGTNIHRGHHVELAEVGTCLEVSAKSSEVYSWSEGCQVFPDFDHFNTFLRICSITKRWQCISQKTNTPGAAGCAFAEAAAGDALGPGEQAFVVAKGENFIRETLQGIEADTDDVKAMRTQVGTTKRPGTLVKERDTKLWSGDDERGLATLQVKDPPSSADAPKIAELMAAFFSKWTDASEQTLADARAHIAVLDETVEVQAAQAPVDAAEQSRLRASIAVLDGTLATTDKAVNDKGLALAATDPALSEEEKTTLRAEIVELRVTRVNTANQRMEQNAALTALGRKAAWRQEEITAARDLLRRKIQGFRADFIRECDIRAQCPQRFDYILIELSDDEISDMDTRFADALNTTWNGNLVFDTE